MGKHGDFGLHLGRAQEDCATLVTLSLSSPLPQVAPVATGECARVRGWREGKPAVPEERGAAVPALRRSSLTQAHAQRHRRGTPLYAAGGPTGSASLPGMVVSIIKALLPPGSTLATLSEGVMAVVQSVALCMTVVTGAFSAGLHFAVLCATQCCGPCVALGWYAYAELPVVLIPCF